MYQDIEAIVRRAGQIVLSAHNIQDGVKQKTDASDLVTIYDPMVQAQLKTELLAAYPDAGFMGEEEDTHDTEGRRRIFIVDPIDGTANFVREVHHSGISVAFTLDGEVEYAAVYNPYYDEMFTAQRGHGAFLNGKPLHCRNVDLKNSIVQVGSAIYYKDTIPATLRFLEELFPNCIDIRRSGSAALDLCYLAAGRCDLFFECCICPWDYAAGSLIAREAGYIVSALDGTPLRLDSRCSVAGGTPANYPELMAISAKIAAEPDMKGRIK